MLGGLQHVADIRAALGRLEADDFASEGHRTILRAIEALNAQGRRADLPQLIDLLEQLHFGSIFQRFKRIDSGI